MTAVFQTVRADEVRAGDLLDNFRVAASTTEKGNVVLTFVNTASRMICLPDTQFNVARLEQ